MITFTGVKDVDAAIRNFQDKALPALKEQKGYSGSNASADRGAGVFAVLSLWDTAADRDASERALASVRQQSAEAIGGEMKVETFEQLVAEVGGTPPGPGSALLVTRIKMDPAKIDDNLSFFKSEVVPAIKGSPGFQGLRNMINRSTGEGVVGTVWADQHSRDQAAEQGKNRRDQALARGVSFGDVSFRDVVLTDFR